MTTSLTGDARRWRVLDRIRARIRCEQLEADLRGCQLAIERARKIRHPFDRRLALAIVQRRLDALLPDLFAARAREASARRDLDG